MAMLQIEQSNNEEQLARANILFGILDRLDANTTTDTVEIGSLVFCDNGIYYLAIGEGSLYVEEKKIYAISLDSPIGKRLNRKKEDDVIVFKGRKIHIKKII